MITSKRTNQKDRRYRGAATVEAAIVIMPLIMIMLGVMGFGYIFLQVEKITTAARIGARVGAAYNATPEQVQTSVDNFLIAQKASYTGPTIDTGIDPGVGNPVTVSVTGTNLDPLNLRNCLFMGTQLFPTTMTVSVTMAKEGPDY
jgi:Flp pilus assembly protein TadG